MQENSLQAGQRLQGNPLESHLRTFVTSLLDALWLGHESVKSTQMYLHADMRLKEKALARTAPLGVNQARYRLCDKLLSLTLRSCGTSLIGGTPKLPRGLIRQVEVSPDPPSFAK
jgi:hypothetical protein